MAHRRAEDVHIAELRKNETKCGERRERKRERKKNVDKMEKTRVYDAGAVLDDELEAPEMMKAKFRVGRAALAVLSR